VNLIEPQAAYERRCGLLPPHPLTSPPQPARKLPRPLGDDFWTATVFDVLRENGDEPTRITSAVNAVAKLGNYTRRADYDQRRIALFRLVGQLIRTGRLDRVGRKHVVIPRTDARRQAYLAAVSAPLDLPPPQV